MTNQAGSELAVSAILNAPNKFPRLKEADWRAVAVKLAKKQVIAAGQTSDTLNELKDVLGEPVFERTLDSLTAFQAKQLAKRIDPEVADETIASCSMALIHIRATLAGEPSPHAVDQPAEKQEPVSAKNKYLGRKAFRTGR